MLKRFAYVPKLAASFVFSIALWVCVGSLADLALFFFFARHSFFTQCDLTQMQGSACGTALVKSAILVLGFPVLYFFLGQMRGFSRVINAIIENHSADFVPLLRPLIQSAVVKIESKIKPELLAKVKGANDHLDQSAPWLVRYIFKSLKGDFLHAVSQGQIDLRSEADIDKTLLKVLHGSALNRKKRMAGFTVALLVLNAVVFLGLLYL